MSKQRFIVRYMTPHIPHRGKITRDFALEDEEFADFLDQYRKTKIGIEQVKKIHVENFEIIESCVESLLEELNGKMVVTSDRGENLYENQFGLQRFDHGQETEECRFVSWLELPCDERNTIRSEELLGFDYSDQGVMNEGLEALGFP